MADEIVRAGVWELELWPGNPRRGDRDAIRESIRVNGVYKPLLVQRGTKRVLVGNNTLIAARELKIPEVDVIYKDVDDEVGRRIMLVDNKASDDADYDDELLREALLAMDDLTGSGWSAEDVEALVRTAEADMAEQLHIELELADDVLVLEDVPTGADWAELPQQTEARAERQASQVTSAVKGTREIMLVYTTEYHAEMIRLLEGLKRAAGGDARNSDIVRELVRKAAREAGLL